MGIERLKARWGVQTTRELVIVFLVFSLAGTSILFVKGPLYQLLRVKIPPGQKSQVPEYWPRQVLEGTSQQLLLLRQAPLRL